MIYLDSAASYPILPEVLEKLQESFAQYANPSSAHLLGQKATSKIEDVRSLVADKLGALPSEIVFTSGATESNNLAIKGCVFGSGKSFSEIHLITSQAEHKCILNIFSYLESLGCSVTYIKPGLSGVVTVEQVAEALQPETLLVSLMHVNNELGAINPVEAVGALCFERGVKFHTDAAQSFCKVELDVLDVEANFVSITAHKIGGPKGIGALYVRDLRTSKIVPVVHGAGQEDGVRGGTLAAPLIEGFGCAIESFPSYYASQSDTIEQALLGALNQQGIQYTLNGLGAPRVKHITSLTMPDINSVLLTRNTEAEFCLAQGSACSSKEVEPSHVLSSIGLERDLASKTFRLSFSHETTEDDVIAFAKCVAELVPEIA